MILSLFISAALASSVPHAFAPPTRGNDSNWALQTIDQAPALSLQTKKSQVIIAIVDTGIDLSHPALRDHLWTNPGESGTDRWGHRKESNGIDDDDNGFVDDLHGWNFVNHNNDVRDLHGHGTHIAGIISQIAPDAKIMVIKYYDPNSISDVSVNATPKSFDYARLMKAQIVNYSGGGPGESQVEREAVTKLANNGILFVAAAGNESQNSDLLHFFPADYNLPNILSVTAISQDQKILPSSNYGKKSVHIAAPGDDIWSTLPGGNYGKMTGTSQATAFVSGVAALKLSTLPAHFSPAKLASCLVNSGQWDESLKAKLKTPVVINSYRALAMKSEQEDAVENSRLLNNDLFLSKKAFELLGR